jgi:inorganic triphosphatase YgiF
LAQSQWVSESLFAKSLCIETSNTNSICNVAQLNAIKAERGLRVEDGTVAPSKPLVEILKEAKEAKEAAFQAVWKSMKTGVLP